MGVRGEQGATLVETAIVFPLIVLLIFGTLAAGLFARSFLAVQNAAAAGARAAAVGATRADADYMAMEAAKRDLSAISLSSVERFVVYKAASANSPVPPACLTSPSGIVGQCNVYNSSDLLLNAAGFNSSGYLKDNSWDATTRQASRTGTTDIVGVTIRARCNCLTQMFGFDPVITRSATVPMESQKY